MQDLKKTQIKIKSWPTPQDYNEAVQNLHSNVLDPQLKAGTVVTGPHGLPKPMTGAFASVYQVHTKQGDWALRCFLREIPDSQWRYEQISQYVKQDSLPYTVWFDFQSAGMRISGIPFPMLKMEWVEGDTLDNYLRAHHTTLDQALPETFKKMCMDLHEAGIAHGDLQHGNIIVRNGEIYLVDYDGMYVPSMKGARSGELGHRNYQHPQRSADHFGPTLDNFSAWVIYTSLSAIAADPSLYERLGGGEDCLLFRKEDFVDPLNSCAFAALENHPLEEIARLGKCVRQFLRLDPDDVPPLSTPFEPAADMPPISADAPLTRAEQASRQSGKPLLVVSPDDTMPPAALVQAAQKGIALGSKITAGPVPVPLSLMPALKASLPDLARIIEPELLVPPTRMVLRMEDDEIGHDLSDGWLLRAKDRLRKNERINRLIQTGIPTRGEITGKMVDDSGAELMYGFWDRSGVRSTDSIYVSPQQYQSARVGEKVTVLYNNQSGISESTVYKYCGVHANGYLHSAAGERAVDLNSVASEVGISRALATPDEGDDLLQAVAQLRSAVRNLKNSGPITQTPSLANVIPPGSPVQAVSLSSASSLRTSAQVALARANSISAEAAWLDPELAQSTPRVLARTNTLAPKQTLLIASLLLLFLSFVTGQVITGLIGLGMLGLMFRTALNESNATWSALVKDGTAAPGYLVGIEHDPSSSSSFFQYIFETKDGKHRLSRMRVPLVSYPNAKVGTRVTILYDASGNNAIYRYCGVRAQKQ